VGRASFRWISDVRLSFAQSLYVNAIDEKSVDPKATDVLLPAVQFVHDRLATDQTNPNRFWHEFRVLVSKQSSVFQSVQQSLKIAECQDPRIDEAAETISQKLEEAKSDYAATFPDLSEQIDLRCRPLRDRWDTCGFGLLRLFEKKFWGGESANQEFWVDDLPLVMIQPARGGDGGFDAISPCVWMEAMLTDVDQQVPEILRLAWLVSCLSADRVMTQRNADREACVVCQLASLALMLDLGTEFDLIRSAELPVVRAMEMWRIGQPSHASILADWYRHEYSQENSLPSQIHTLQNRLSRDA